MSSDLSALTARTSLPLADEETENMSSLLLGEKLSSIRSLVSGLQTLHPPRDLFLE